MNNHSHTILLVDDEQDILEFLSYNLRQEGFNVHTAANGRIAASPIGALLVSDYFLLL